MGGRIFLHPACLSGTVVRAAFWRMCRIRTSIEGAGERKHGISKCYAHLHQQF